MPTIRKSVKDLVRLGPFPPMAASPPERVQEYQGLLASITPPLTDQEAIDLLSIFGDDDYFGLAWTLLHLIETAPSPPLDSAPAEDASEWIRRLWNRAQRKQATD